MRFVSYTLLFPNLITFLFTAVITTNLSKCTLNPSVISFQMTQVAHSSCAFTVSGAIRPVITSSKSAGWLYGSRGAMQVRSLSRILSLSFASEVVRDGFSFTWFVTSLSTLWSDMFAMFWTILLQVSTLYAHHFMVLDFIQAFFSQALTQKYIGPTPTVSLAYPHSLSSLLILPRAGRRMPLPSRHRASCVREMIGVMTMLRAETRSATGVGPPREKRRGEVAVTRYGTGTTATCLRRRLWVKENTKQKQRRAKNEKRVPRSGKRAKRTEKRTTQSEKGQWPITRRWTDNTEEARKGGSWAPRYDKRMTPRGRERERPVAELHDKTKWARKASGRAPDAIRRSRGSSSDAARATKAMLESITEWGRVGTVHESHKCIRR